MCDGLITSVGHYALPMWIRFIRFFYFDTLPIFIAHCGPKIDQKRPSPQSTVPDNPSDPNQSIPVPQCFQRFVFFKHTIEVVCV